MTVVTPYSTDPIHALGEVSGGLKVNVTLAKTKRTRMRLTLDEACCPIDTTLNMVIIRLGDILLLTGGQRLPL